MEQWLIPLAALMVATVGMVTTVLLTTRKMGTDEVIALRAEVRALHAELVDVHRQLADCRSENGDMMRRMFRLEDQLATQRTVLEGK